MFFFARFMAIIVRFRAHSDLTLQTGRGDFTYPAASIVARGPSSCVIFSLGLVARA